MHTRASVTTTTYRSPKPHGCRQTAVVWLTNPKSVSAGVAVRLGAAHMPGTGAEKTEQLGSLGLSCLLVVPAWLLQHRSFSFNPGGARGCKGVCSKRGRAAWKLIPFSEALHSRSLTCRFYLLEAKGFKRQRIRFFLLWKACPRTPDLFEPFTGKEELPEPREDRHVERVT